MKLKCSYRTVVFVLLALTAETVPLVGAFAGTLPSGSIPEIAVAAHPKPAVSWKNAPSPDPGYLDGYFMLYDPLKPSGGPYPVLSKGERIWIDVSISQQLVYIFHGTHLIYTMATSSGMQYIKGDGSPPGVYQIQAERGKWFYVPSEHVGAEYWVSWRGNGNYLFHSVPMTRNKKIMPYVAARLLHEASFGCFLLTIPDAKWIYDHVRYGTTVIVERAQVLLQGATIVYPSETQYLAAYLSGVPSTGSHR
jgi:hypothetical protein